jgi:integrase
MKILDSAQTAALLAAAEHSFAYVPIVLAVATGVRRGEVLGLRWADVDLERATASIASIAQTLEETDRGGLAFKPPKTERSRRLIALPAIAIDVLRRHRARQAEERLRAGRDWIDNGLVCCDALGRPLSPRRVTKAFRQLRRSLGLDGARFHDLRHGYASMLLALGTHPKVVQEALGHSSVSITLDIYSHLMPGMQRDAANGIDTMLRTHLEQALPKSG